MAKIAIFLKLPGNDFSVSGGADEIDHDQVGLKPMRGVKSKCGIAFLADGILADAFESPANRASNVRLVIDEKNFFKYLHEIASYSEHRLCQQLVPAGTLHAWGFSRAGLNQRKLDTRINGERQDHGVEAERQNPVHQHQPPHFSRRNIYIGNL